MHAFVGPYNPDLQSQFVIESKQFLKISNRIFEEIVDLKSL